MFVSVPKQLHSLYNVGKGLVGTALAREARGSSPMGLISIDIYNKQTREV
jgi:hypothetical protein